MIQRLLLTILLLGYAVSVAAQANPDTTKSSVPSPEAIKASQTLRRDMELLTGWGLGNAIIGGYALSQAPMAQTGVPFWQMNLAWGLINAGIGAIGVIDLAKHPADQVKLSSMERTVNYALISDAAFLTTGAAMVLYAPQMSTADQQESLRQSGYAVLVQSLALSCFDLYLRGRIRRLKYSR